MASMVTTELFDRVAVQTLLKQSVVSFLQKHITFQTTLQVEALVGITVDKDNILLMNINTTCPKIQKLAPGPPTENPGIKLLQACKRKLEVQSGGSVSQSSVSGVAKKVRLNEACSTLRVSGRPSATCTTTSGSNVWNVDSNSQLELESPTSLVDLNIIKEEPPFEMHCDEIQPGRSGAPKESASWKENQPTDVVPVSLYSDTHTPLALSRHRKDLSDDPEDDHEDDDDDDDTSDLPDDDPGDESFDQLRRGLKIEPEDNDNMDSSLQVERRSGRISSVKKEFVDDQKNLHTARKTASDVNQVEAFLHGRNERRDIVEIPPAELDPLLAQFFFYIRKIDGSEYEADSLSGMHMSIARYLNFKKYGHNIRISELFTEHRAAVSAKKKYLKQLGKGNRQNKSKPFSDAEIQTMYEMGILGVASPEALLYTMWLNITKHFGIRGRHEHNDMVWGDIELKVTTNGKRYLEFLERATRSPKSQSRKDKQSADSKIFEDPGNSNCPVKVYLAYKERRPDNCNDKNSPFYLNPATWHPDNSVWFSRLRVGKNKLGSFARTAAKKAGLNNRRD